MTAFGPQGRGASFALPPANLNRYGDKDTWFRDCSSGSANDATVIDAQFLNTILGNLREAVRGAGIPLVQGDMALLSKAMKAYVEKGLVRVTKDGGLVVDKGALRLALGTSQPVDADAIDVKSDRLGFFDASGGKHREATIFNVLRSALRQGSNISLAFNEQTGEITFSGPAIGAAVPQSRTVAGVGALEGGGSLAADVQISVKAAGIVASMLAANSVERDKIANEAVNGSKIAPGSIAQSHLTNTLLLDLLNRVNHNGEQAISTITGLQAALNAKTNAVRTITGGGLATGGGDGTADRVITVPKSSNAQAVAGTDDSTAMTPVRVKDSVLTFAPAEVDATTTTRGVVTFATNPETVAGLSASKAVTPAGLQVALNNAIAGLVNSSPAALDTLSELAAALGNDPNFATSVTTLIGTKLNASAYTAADVLAKLLTVDGVGSGLDADLLDGLDSSAFARLTGAAYTGGVTVTTDSSAVPLITTRYAGTANLQQRRANGTVAAPSAVATSDILTSISSFGYDGANFIAGAYMRSIARGVATNRISTSWVWGTMSLAGLLADRMELDTEGNLIVSGTVSSGGTPLVPQTRAVTAGTGLSGGGSLTADRAFAFDTAWGDARYDTRAGTAHPNSVNLNTLTTQGNGYLGATPVNAPESGCDYASIFIVGSANVRTQYLARYQGDKAWFRSGSDSGSGYVWGPWREVIHSGNMPSGGSSPLITAVLNDQVFNSSGTWTKPAVNGTWAVIDIWNGGQGGGRDTSGWTRRGGAGAPKTTYIVPFALLPGIASVIVGSGGTTSGSNQNNVAGNWGGVSSVFGLYGVPGKTYDDASGVWTSLMTGVNFTLEHLPITVANNFPSIPAGTYFAQRLVEYGSDRWTGTNTFGTPTTVAVDAGGSGGSVTNTGTVIAPVTPSGVGGPGGAASTTTGVAGSPGTQPGGGGGAGFNAAGGTGGAGRVRIRIY